MITLRRISRQFLTTEVRTQAIHELNLVIEQGEFVAIMGPSGCGKSTLLNILGLLDRPDSGEFLFFGEDISRASLSRLAALRKQHIGFVFQNFNLIEELSVRENIALPLLYHRLSSQEIRSRVEDVMTRLGLSHRANHYPPQLSGGQQQRVAVARAIVTKPALILADEPTGNLDSANGREVLDLLSHLHGEGTTIVMVTHNEEDAKRSTRIERMRDGQLITTQSIVA